MLSECVAPTGEGRRLPLCHLLLLLPIVALPVFWLLPPVVAVPLYAVATCIALLVYGAAIKAMRRPVVTGREHMLGSRGKVVRAEGGHLTLNVDGELWAGICAARQLEVGDRVSVVGMDGLRLRVEPEAADRASVRPK